MICALDHIDPVPAELELVDGLDLLQGREHGDLDLDPGRFSLGEGGESRIVESSAARHFPYRSVEGRLRCEPADAAAQAAVEIERHKDAVSLVLHYPDGRVVAVEFQPEDGKYRRPSCGNHPGFLFFSEIEQMV